MPADRTLSGFTEFWQLQILSMLLKQFTQQSSDIHGDCLNYVEGRHGKSSIDWYALAAQSDACPTGDQKVAVFIYRGQVRQHSFFETDHVIRFTTSLFLLLIEEGQFSVFGERAQVLIYRIESWSRKRMVRYTDRLLMTLKVLTQSQNSNANHCNAIRCSQNMKRNVKKCTFGHVRPAKSQICMRIQAV